MNFTAAELDAITGVSECAQAQAPIRRAKQETPASASKQTSQAYFDDSLEQIRIKAKRMGPYMAPRWLRNKGLSFEFTYFALFGRMPRL